MGHEAQVILALIISATHARQVEWTATANN
jgi:hypothetical protein